VSHTSSYFYADDDLIDAAGAGSTRRAVQALADGADPRRARDIDGATALMLAAHSADPELVTLLLPLSDPRAVDFEGWSALICAAAAGSSSCAQVLLPLSDPLALDRQGRRAFDLVAYPGSEWNFLEARTLSAHEFSELSVQETAPSRASAPTRRI
jgi:ankyrin repeat protein